MAVALSVPYERGLNIGVRIIDGKHAGIRDSSSTAYVTPGYFRTLRIPLLAGRLLSDSDTPNSEAVAIAGPEGFVRRDPINPTSIMPCAGDL